MSKLHEYADIEIPAIGYKIAGKIQQGNINVITPAYVETSKTRFMVFDEFQQIREYNLDYVMDP